MPLEKGKRRTAPGTVRPAGAGAKAAQVSPSRKKAPAAATDVTGVLKRRDARSFTLVDLVRPAAEVIVPAALIQAQGLVQGATVSGPVTEGSQGRTLTGVTAVCGLAPETFRQRRPLAELTAVDPQERFRLAAAGIVALRAIDLLAPIGKGTRGLIAAPPKAGKTTLLEEIAAGIRAAQPEARIIVLLIDERPEELTYFRRSVSAEVLASTSDRPPAEHTALAEFMLDHARVELECGHDVVILLDSLTRLSRAFNLQGRGAGRTLSGGIDAAALEIPRRLFGLARQIEGGGSVTVLATILIETGSQMDQVIYEEFKSTGNSEIVLSRALAQDRIFPAIDIATTGTRKEELLYDAEEARRLAGLRRGLAGYRPREAMPALLRLLAQYPTNEALLAQIPKQSETKRNAFGG
ncbi:MAG TPA: transcription termination factor Rho [Anaerolineae bacterium]